MDHLMYELISLMYCSMCASHNIFRIKSSPIIFVSEKEITEHRTITVRASLKTFKFYSEFLLDKYLIFLFHFVDKAYIMV